MKEGEFSFELFKAGETIPIQTVTNKADGSYSFETINFTEFDLDKDADGNFVETVKKYTVKEKVGEDKTVTFDPKVYTITVTLKDDGKGNIDVTADPKENTYDFTNTYEVVSISGKKIWDDNNDVRKLRPASITLRLFANDVEIAVKSFTAGADGSWTYSFGNLPKFDETGKEIQYHVTEDAVPGYMPPMYRESDIINRCETGKTNVSVIKWWDDGNDYDRIRPLSVTVRLFANRQPTGKILVLSSANGWQGTFEDLDLYSADGKPIVYEITEDSVLYYKTRITGDQLNGYHIVNYHRVDRVVGNWPRTGDDSNIQAWLIPFAVSGAALAGGGGAFLYRKKKKNLKKENDSLQK